MVEDVEMVAMKWVVRKTAACWLGTDQKIGRKLIIPLGSISGAGGKEAITWCPTEESYVANPLFSQAF